MVSQVCGVQATIVAVKAREDLIIMVVRVEMHGKINRRITAEFAQSTNEEGTTSIKLWRPSLGKMFPSCSNSV